MSPTFGILGILLGLFGLGFFLVWYAGREIARKTKGWV